MANVEDLVEGKVQKPNATMLNKIGYRAQSPDFRRIVGGVGRGKVKKLEREPKTARICESKRERSVKITPQKQKVVALWKAFEDKKRNNEKGFQKVHTLRLEDLLKNTRSRVKTKSPQPKKALIIHRLNKKDSTHETSSDIPEYEEAEINPPNNFRASKLLRRFHPIKFPTYLNQTGKNKPLFLQHTAILTKLLEFLDAAELYTLLRISPLFHPKVKYYLKKLLYKGLRTESRIFYWHAIANLSVKHMKDKYEFGEFLKRPCGAEVLISQDIIRTFPPLDYFKTNHEGYKKMLRILKCISLKFPAVGYCQGMNFIAGLIMLFLTDEINSYGFVKYLFNELDLKACYVAGMPKLKLLCYQLDCLVSVYLPKLHLLLGVTELKAEIYASQWLLTFFAYDFPIETAGKALDLFLVEGWKAVLKLALGLLSFIQDYAKEPEGLMLLLKTFNKTHGFYDVLFDDMFVERAKWFKVTRSMLTDLEEIHQKTQEKSAKLKIVVDPITKKRRIKKY